VLLLLLSSFVAREHHHDHHGVGLAFSLGGADRGRLVTRVVTIEIGPIRNQNLIF